MWQDVLLIAITIYLTVGYARHFWRCNRHVFHGQKTMVLDSEKLECHSIEPEPWSGLQTMKFRDLTF